MKTITKNFGARRDILLNGRKWLADRGIVPQRTKLKALAQLKTGENKLRFSFTKDQSLNLPVEMLLGKSDFFAGSAMGIALLIEKDGFEGMAMPMSYPLQAGKHLPAHLAGFENGNVSAVYNGKLIQKTNSTVNYSRFPLDECLYVPETQPVAIVNADGSDIIPSGLIPAFNIENVLVQLEEVLYFSGSKNQPIEIEFTLKAGEGFGVPAGHKAYVMLIVDGFIYESLATSTNDVEGNPFKGLML